MAKQIGALVFIFIMTSLAWIILGGVTDTRSRVQDRNLKKDVAQLWGSVQMQKAPNVQYQVDSEKEVERTVDGKKTVEKEIVTQDYQATLEKSDIAVGLNLEYRKKGLLWYSTYGVDFSGEYLIKNDQAKSYDFFFTWAFPNRDGIYDNFIMTVDGKPVDKLSPESGMITLQLPLEPDETRLIKISYSAQGMDEWWYLFGDGVSQIKNFKMTMTTDFDDINFPENGIAPLGKEKTDSGWNLTWEYTNLISGIQIGMEMPKKLNPGPFVSKVSYFAPVSLFLFMFLMFIITIVRKIKIHPMNYFFIAASFFSFHLLLAYLVDHIDLHLAFAICSAVSIFLVISYMRLVIGLRFAFLEIGLSQFVYLVLFSYAFFLEGFTGLAITACCVLTLFVIMQFTARFNWEKEIAERRMS